MISKRAATLSELAGHLQAAKVLATDRELYNTRLTELRKAREQGERLVRTWKVLRETEIIPASKAPPGADGELRLMIALLTAYKLDASVVKEDLYSNATQNFEAHMNAFEQGLKDTWRKYCDSLAPGVQDEVLNVLGRLSSLRDPVKRLQSQRDAIEKGRRTLPQSTQDVAQVRSAAKIVTMEWSRLAGDGLPPAVLTFLKGVMTNGATLDTLTPEVLAWLRERQLQHLFRITASGPQ